MADFQVNEAHEHCVVYIVTVVKQSKTALEAIKCIQKYICIYMSFFSAAIVEFESKHDHCNT